MNFFKWFDIELAFTIDLKILKKQYFLKSREVHPDHSSNIDENELSSYNKEAYNILRKELSRYAYLIEQFSNSVEKTQLPQSFLLEMMELNEDIEQHPKNAESKDILAELEKTISAISAQMRSSISSIILKSPQELDDTEWKKLDEFISKQKYILRIKEKMVI